MTEKGTRRRRGLGPMKARRRDPRGSTMKPLKSTRGKWRRLRNVLEAAGYRISIKEITVKRATIVPWSDAPGRTDEDIWFLDAIRRFQIRTIERSETNNEGPLPFAKRLKV